MAMSVEGKNKHYYWSETLKRHWASMARKVRFPEDELAGISRELLDPMEDVINRVASSLPAGFPAAVAEPVFNGMRAAKLKLGEVPFESP